MKSFDTIMPLTITPKFRVELYSSTTGKNSFNFFNSLAEEDFGERLT